MLPSSGMGRDVKDKIFVNKAEEFVVISHTCLKKIPVFTHFRSLRFFFSSSTIFHSHTAKKSSYTEPLIALYKIL